MWKKSWLSKKNETGFLLKQQSSKIHVDLFYIIIHIQVNLAYKNYSEQFKKAEILIPDFSNSKF